MPSLFEPQINQKFEVNFLNFPTGKFKMCKENVSVYV